MLAFRGWKSLPGVAHPHPGVARYLKTMRGRVYHQEQSGHRGPGVTLAIGGYIETFNVLLPSVKNYHGSQNVKKIWAEDRRDSFQPS